MDERAWMNERVGTSVDERACRNEVDDRLQPVGTFYHGGKFHYILATVQRPEMLKFFSRLSPKRISLRTCLSRPPAWNPHFVYILKKLLNCLYILTKQRGNPLVLGIDWFPCDERRV